ncbi:MAG: hypothetical protein R3268_00010 [Acidiferrobacterales bacterium]|nr:hypothetical protein [Acidiferrobacterales bacterium]
MTKQEISAMHREGLSVGSVTLRAERETVVAGYNGTQRGYETTYTGEKDGKVMFAVTPRHLPDRGFMVVWCQTGKVEIRPGTEKPLDVAVELAQQL